MAVLTRTRRRTTAILALVAVLAGACAVVTTRFRDDRIDLTRRPKGTVVVIGDSVGYGMMVFGNAAGRLALDGWGPVRTFSELGMHARPETPTDVHNVVTEIARLRADGYRPNVVVLVIGANDVGFAGGRTVAANAERVRAAMRAIGNVPVVWTTISHPLGDQAWNWALFQVASENSNLHVCDWKSVLAQKPWYLTDGVHMTTGPNGGYVAMADYVTGCVRAISLPPPPTTTTTAPTTTEPSTTTSTSTSRTTTTTKP